MATRKVEKRTLPSGKITYRAPYLDGGGARRSKNFATSKEAKAFLLTVGNELQLGTHTPSSQSPTIAEAAELWLAHCERRRLEPMTLAGYRQHVTLHMLPLIGETKLSALTTTAVHAFTDRLHEAGRSADMIRRVVISLSGIFAESRRRGLVATSPTSGINKRESKRDNPRATIPTKAELRAIIDAARNYGPRWYAFILTAIFAGLRASELRGLSWDNVDLAEGLLHVTQRADARCRIGKPKSKASYRTIPLPPLVTQSLREWKLQCPKGALNLVFPNRCGNAFFYSDIITQGYAPILAAAGLTEHSGLHALRHACASLWIDQGFNPKRIQALMGHSSIAMTFDRYGHLFADGEADQRAAARLQQSLLGS